jgi:glycosyltransferase involved in cell wall biosynthesis
MSQHSTRFVFVDDGSTDDTHMMLLAMASSSPPGRVTVIRHSTNIGKGEAVRRGLQAAFRHDSQFVGFWDADLATPLDAINDLASIFASRPSCQMVFGSRVKLLGRDIHRTASRHYLGRTFATFAAIVLKLAIYDTQCGAKLFRATAEMAALFDTPFSSRWVFDVEIIARRILNVGSANQVANEICEYPLHVWRDVAGSKVKPRHFLIALRDIAIIHRRYRPLIR